jgi:SAM-dependent methyltransferase
MCIGTHKNTKKLNKEFVMKVEKIRKNVSKAYARAISGTKKSLCSAAAQSCCSPATDQSKSIAGLAGYTETERKIQPKAAASSFACGNPLAYSNVKEGDVVLDLGSGAGFDLLLAAEKVGESGWVIGVDMTDDMIAAARKNIKAHGAENVEVRKGIIEQLPVDNESVDWVISNCVINLSPEKQKVFAEIARVLKPGGRMSVSDIVVQELPNEIRQNESLYNSCIAGAISEEDYLSGLQNAGLTDVQVVDRLVYDPEQIKHFFHTDEVPGLKDMLEAIPPDRREETINSLLTQVKGKIWSAKFSAIKPAG